MRLAPVPLYYAADPAQAIQHASDSSRTTHGAPNSIDACRYYAGLIVGALDGVSKDDLLATHYCPLAGYWDTHLLVTEIDEIARGSFKLRQPPEIKGTGYVVKSLEAALWAFYRSDDFRTGCLLAANLGDDSDTTAAIYGQLAGAFYGEAGIPATWVEKLAMREYITELAIKLMT